MAEQQGVLCWTTVAAGGYTAGSGVLNVASTSAGSGPLPFPGAATFSVSISDPTTHVVKTLLRVTGINSSTQFATASVAGLDVSCVLGDIVEAVIDSVALTAIVAGTAWAPLAPLYVNGWIDTGGGNQVGQYMKDGTGRVWLRGQLAPGTTTANTTLFTLPAGFRPVGPLLLYGVADNGSVVTSVLMRLNVSSAGAVQLGYVFPTAVVLTLDGVSFSVN